jgi:hypothetical protein
MVCIECLFRYYLWRFHIQRTATSRLETVLDRVEACEERMRPIMFMSQLDDALMLISSIEKISLEVKSVTYLNSLTC